MLTLQVVFLDAPQVVQYERIVSVPSRRGRGDLDGSARVM